jgi:hypothetical protein
VIKLASTISLAGLLMGSTTANAAFCADGHPSVRAEYAASAFVVEAKVSGIEHDLGNAPDKDYSDLHDRITLRVIKSFKGSGRFVFFNSTHDSARIPVDVGDEVLMFVRKERNGQNYVDTCGSSDLASRVDKRIFRELEELALGRR